MIPNVSRGNGFRGKLEYDFGPGKRVLAPDGGVLHKLKPDRATLIGGNMSGRTPRELSTEFGVSRALRPKAKNPCWGCSLNSAEKLSVEQWQEFALAFLQRIGIDPDKHQWCMVRHDDRAHDHVHLTVSRIGLDSKLWGGAQDVKKSQKACRALEKKFGLAQVTPNIDEKSLSKDEIEKALREGEAPARAYLQEQIKAALADNPTVPQFLECMEIAEITVRPNIAKNGKMAGFSYSYNGIPYKASQLGKSYGWPAMIASGRLQYDRKRDTELLQAAKKASADAWGIATPVEQGKPDTRYKMTLDLAFEQTDNGFVWRSYPNRVAFVDKGDQITNISSNRTAIKATVQLARQKGWTKICFTSTSRSFIESSYLEARLQGYKPEDIQIEKHQLSADRLAVLEEKVNDQQNRRSARDGKDKSADNPGQDRTFDRSDRADGASHGRAGGPVEKRDQSDEKRKRALPPETKDTNGKERPQPKRRISKPHRGQPGDDQYGSAYNRRSGRDEDDPQSDHMESDNLVNLPGPAMRDSSRERILALAQNPLDQKQGYGLLDAGGGKKRDKRAITMKSHIHKKEVIWRQQAAALGAPAYRITITDSKGKAKPWNLGKGKGPDGEEKFYTIEEVQKMLPMLSGKNAQGRNIFVTPKDDNYHYIVLDDTTLAKVGELQQRGFKPAFIQESSPGNIQAIYKVTKKKNSTEQIAANSVVQRLNIQFGDPNFSGAVHPFRLAGFTNQKHKHKDQRGNSPFVQIHSAQGGTCENMARILADARTSAQKKAQKLAQKKAKVSAQERTHAIEMVDMKNFNYDRGLDIRFQQAWKKWHGLAVQKVQKGSWEKINPSAIDFRACKDLLRDDSPEDVKQALIANSPAIETRHQNMEDYAARTVRAADQERAQEIARDRNNDHGLDM